MGFWARLFGKEKKPTPVERTARIAPPHMTPARRPASAPTRRPSRIDDDEIVTSTAFIDPHVAMGDFDYDGTPDYAESHSDSDSSDSSSHDSGSSYSGSDSSSSDYSGGSSYSGGSDSSSYDSGSSSYDSGSSGGFDSSSF